jgi:transposase
LGAAYGRAVARFARNIWALEQCISTVQSVVTEGRLGADFQGFGGRPRFRARYDRRHHRAGAPACGWRKRGTQNQAIGRSRGGLSTKIHIAVDALGHPLRMVLTAGQVHEATQASLLIEGLTLISLIADKGYDNDRFRAELAESEVDVVIPPLGSRVAEIDYDKNSYGLRYRIECFINKIKHYRRVATRYEKTARNFLSMLALAAAMIWLRDIA